MGVNLGEARCGTVTTFIWVQVWSLRIMGHATVSQPDAAAPVCLQFLGVKLQTLRLPKNCSFKEPKVRGQVTQEGVWSMCALRSSYLSITHQKEFVIQNISFSLTSVECPLNVRAQEAYLAAADALQVLVTQESWCLMLLSGTAA